MIKLTLLMKRKPEMSFDEFRDYYENRHAPLASANCPNMVGYRRTYITETVPMARSANPPDLDFDCITECWYDVEGTWEERSKDLLPPDVFKRMAADEENFLDRKMTRLLITEEAISPAETLLGNRTAPSRA